MLKVFFTSVEIQGLCAMIYLPYIFLRGVQKAELRQTYTSELKISVASVASSLRVDAVTSLQELDIFLLYYLECLSS